MGVMGAVQFALKGDEKEANVLPFLEKQRIYSSEITILNNKYLVERTFRDDVQKLISTNISENDINSIIQQYTPNLKNKKCKITGLSYPKFTILLYSTGLMIQNSKLIEYNYDIFKLIKRVYNSINLSEEEIEKCKYVEEFFQKEFEIDLRLLVYDVTKGIINNIMPSLYSYFNLNFTLKDNFQPHIITLILNEPLLTKVDLIESLSETIRYCPTLKIVNFILIPLNNEGKLVENFGLDGLMFTMLYKLIEAVSLNRAIKSFFLHSAKDYSITMAPEISNLIIKKMQSETLIALHIGNFFISNEFNKKLIFQLSSTRSLLFVSLENKFFSKDSISLLNNILRKNKSILAFSIVSPFFNKMKPEIINKFKSTLRNKTKLEVINLSGQSLFNSFLN